MTLFRIFPQVFCPVCGVLMFYIHQPLPEDGILMSHTNVATKCPNSGKTYRFEWPTIEGTEVTQ